MPISCPFEQTGREIQSKFGFNELKCGLHRSSVIQIYYKNDSHPMNPGEYFSPGNVMSPPIVQLNLDFLSKLNYKSFVLILIDPTFMPDVIHLVILHWIRYFSLSLENGHDVCHYHSIHTGIRTNQQKVFLLYATNSSQMMIRAKSTCNDVLEWFQLTDYVAFIKLKLIGATHFFIVPVKNPDDQNYD